MRDTIATRPSPSSCRIRREHAFAVALGLSLAAAGNAAGWQFAEPLAVTGAPRPGVFHHLESAGRASLAVSATTLAVTWEDNGSGTPRAHVAFKDLDGGGFEAPVPVSGGGEAFAPAIVGLASGRFVVAWEQAGAVWARVAAPGTLGPPQRLDVGPAAQVTLGIGPGGEAYAAWARREGRLYRIVVGRLAIRGQRLQVAGADPVDPAPPTDQQLYPALAVTGRAVTVAWEDRRHGHTRLYYSHALHGESFGALRQLNEQLPPRSARFGRGTGVTRVALASAGSRVAAAWMDKRYFEGGYDIYAAHSRDGGRRFGPNERVQDLFGEHTPQWHPDAALGPDGRVVVAWDDPRDGSADLWMSWRGPEGWSDDLAVPGATGPGDQTHPVLAFDSAGWLHLVWVARETGTGTRLWYTSARHREDPSGRALEPESSR
ncbi:MAG: hypothetical protein GWO16_03495 [Gammaproteobacteria bacterium]|nr:hypothetical protein [Gammaproteobacteria bacterium]NIR97165.1 hypothetical protein [Gammaproteobacteria bacterium]NIT62867.1 hypothetical protein [Gammaproteobacteria bacterium]NIV19832.1 hypothetical protein [Gammaproteobacteria bacterium]NIY31447.1 hypothetical protein [Gammaproteobacteria bacterium]